MVRPNIVGVDGLVWQGVLAWFSANGGDWCEEGRNVVRKSIDESNCGIGGLYHGEIGCLIGWGGNGDVVAAGDVLEDFWGSRGSAELSVHVKKKVVVCSDFPPSANATIDMVREISRRPLVYVVNVFDKLGFIARQLNLDSIADDLSSADVGAELRTLSKEISMTQAS